MTSSYKILWGTSCLADEQLAFQKGCIGVS